MIVLVNNAGVMVLAGDVDGATITREIAINLTAPILLVRRCLPLLQHGRRPLIVMVTSGYALLPARRAPTYSATKAGVRAFTQALRYQLQDSGIRVIETLPPSSIPQAPRASTGRRWHRERWWMQPWRASHEDATSASSGRFGGCRY
jgi:short-subunit dehydrogenase involved in D-alanine esterification of teichoic acids